MAGSPASSGSTRAHSDSMDNSQRPRKRVKVIRRLQHVQMRPEHVEPVPQDPVFVQGQLLRSISAALAMAGFDSVRPTALEMFRSNVEEYMLNFLHYARTSMSTNRRTNPTAIDFASALALMPNTSTASLLSPQLKLPVPEVISYPSISEPDPPPLPAPDFSLLLQPLVDNQTPRHIPSHFPKLPPQHAWKHTAVYPEREKDARRMRERATDEGILAEQALRKLAAAAKSGAVKAEKRRLDVLSGPGLKVSNAGIGVRGSGKEAKARRESELQEEMFAGMMKQVTGDEGDADEDAVMDLGAEGVRELQEGGMDVGMPEGVVVNSEMNGWRRGGRKAVRT